MFDEKNSLKCPVQSPVEALCCGIKNAIIELEKEVSKSNNKIPTKQEVQSLVSTTCLLNALNEKALSLYEKSGTWAVEGYLTGKAALVHETHLNRKTVETALTRGSFLRKYPSISEAIFKNEITSDHLNSFIFLAGEKYVEHFQDDIELLLQTAKSLSAPQFSNVVKHYKSMVDSLEDYPTDEYQAFEDRKLFLNELLDGKWFIHGELDPITGKILNKALSDISQKLYRSSENNLRENYIPAQQRADAIGYLAQNYIAAKSNTSVALLNADITIDLSDVDPKSTITDYLNKCIATNSPIVKAHSKKYIEQVLCDCSMHSPIKKSDGTFNLGRKVRTAPWRMKKQLLLSSQTCSVPGCCAPSNWCDAHHVKHWVHGGETKIENLALLCRRHHTMVHNDKNFEEKVSKWIQHESLPVPTG